MAEMTQAEKQAFGKTKATGDRLPNIRHGKYLMMVDKWFLHRSFRGELSDVHNFVVLKADPITAMVDGKPVNETPNEVGTRCSATFKWAGRSVEMAQANSLKFVAAMLGLNPDKMSEDDRNEAIGRMANDTDGKVFPDEEGLNIPIINPCRGMLIRCETYPILTKETKQWIIGVAWEHVASPGSADNAYETAAQRWVEFEARMKALAA